MYKKLHVNTILISLVEDYTNTQRVEYKTRRRQCHYNDDNCFPPLFILYIYMYTYTNAFVCQFLIGATLRKCLIAI